MNEALYILIGSAVGGTLCTIGFSLGAYYIKSTYVELTQPHTTNNTVESNKPQVEEDSYNWDTYDQATQPQDYEEVN
jgi:hypothetical protein|tara:strand:- start:57 stop:287 length:231 start_codon:yes stop_codon:yes gene_type:complete